MGPHPKREKERERERVNQQWWRQQEPVTDINNLSSRCFLGTKVGGPQKACQKIIYDPGRHDREGEEEDFFNNGVFVGKSPCGGLKRKEEENIISQIIFDIFMNKYKC